VGAHMRAVAAATCVRLPRPVFANHPRGGEHREHTDAAVSLRPDTGDPRRADRAGYVHIPAVLSADEVAYYRAIVDELADKHYDPKQGLCTPSERPIYIPR